MASSAHQHDHAPSVRAGATHFARPDHGVEQRSQRGWTDPRLPLAADKPAKPAFGQNPARTGIKPRPQPTTEGRSVTLRGHNVNP